MDRDEVGPEIKRKPDARVLSRLYRLHPSNHLSQSPPVSPIYLHTTHSDTTRDGVMDFVKNLAGGNKEGEQQQGQQQGEQKSEGGFMSKLNNMAGGGAAGEKKEDGLDKGK